jgi:mannosyltransferase
MRTLFKPATSYLVQPRYEWSYLALVLILALVYRLSPMSRGLGQDELYTAIHFVEAGSIWNTLFSNEAFNNHIGYSLMARVSETVFGRSEWALRLPALLMGLATLYLFWIFGRPILGHPVIMLATLMFALSPPHVIWSIEARGYSAMIFFTLVSSYLYLKLLRRPSKLDSALFILASVCGIYVHLYSVFVTLVQMLLLLLGSMAKQSATAPGPQQTEGSSRILYVAFLMIVTLSLLSYLPVSQPMLRDIAGRGRSDFNPWFPWAVIQELTGSESVPVVVPVIIVSILGWSSLMRSYPFETRYFTWLLAGPLLVMWLARPFDLYPRFFAFWLPYYFVFFAAGLGTLWYLASPASSPALTYLSPTLAAAIVVVVLYHWSASWQRYIPDEGYREASRAIMTNADDSVGFCAIGGARSVWRYYIHRPIATPFSLAEFRQLSKAHPEVRCVYYEASWQDREQSEIAQFLLQRGSWKKVKHLTLFRYRD